MLSTESTFFAQLFGLLFIGDEIMTLEPSYSPVINLCLLMLSMRLSSFAMPDVACSNRSNILVTPSLLLHSFKMFFLFIRKDKIE